MNKQNQRGFAVLIFLIFVAINLIIGGLCTEYVLEYWLSFTSGKTVQIPFWVCAVVGLFLGEFMIPATLITWLLSFFIVCSACV